MHSLRINLYNLEQVNSSKMIDQSQHSKFNFKIMQDQSIRIRKVNKYNHLSTGNILKNSSQIRSTLKDEKNLFTHIKQAGIYSEDRKETFVRFNFRTIQSQTDFEISTKQNSSTKYGPFHLKTLQSTNHSRDEVSQRRGTMNVNELWCDKNLHQIMGFPLYPKDRMKILNFYKNSSTADRRKWVKQNIK